MPSMLYTWMFEDVLEVCPGLVLRHKKRNPPQRLLPRTPSVFAESSEHFIGFRRSLYLHQPKTMHYDLETPNSQNKIKWDALVISKHFLHQDLVHHPIETTIYKWMFGDFQSFSYIKIWFIIQLKQPFTLPETYIAPENGWLEDEFPFGKPYLQGLC